MEIPKNFIIRCHKCRWARMSSGISSDLIDLHEIKTCDKCGKPREFKCPNCGLTAKMLRIKRN
jgi:predicted RNA-binding Zn-ribbon protein involved in translation (DUF1610 family)